MATTKRTQHDRRIETQRLLLQSATRLFGERGYDETSLEDIARACGLTTGPVYHYFGSKKELFRHVHEAVLEQTFARLRKIQGEDLKAHMLLQLKETLDTYKQPQLFRILLIDSPVVLGEERWSDQQFIMQLSVSLLGTQLIDTHSLKGLRLLYAAAREAIIVLVEAENQSKTRQYLIDTLTPLVIAIVEQLEQFAAIKASTRKKIAKKS
ncbi:MAG TPA: helix-turn-helix domain-containing protein [Spongiibacteraceae bacterium]